MLSEFRFQDPSIEMVNSRAAADSPEQQVIVDRIFALGLTKLYVLRSISTDTLKRFLDEGILITMEDGTERRITLETARVSQLKRLVAKEGAGRKKLISKDRSSTKRTLAAVVHTQARALGELARQCLHELSNQEVLSDHLQTIE